MKGDQEKFFLVRWGVRVITYNEGRAFILVSGKLGKAIKHKSHSTHPREVVELDWETKF